MDVARIITSRASRQAQLCKELEALDQELHQKLGEADIRHLRRVELRGRLSTLVGLLSATFFPNPISAFLISFGQFTRWMIAHHVLHRGYDKVPGIPARFTSRVFARGWRRFIDWHDWIHPTGWDYEHNVLHHYHTQENADPDLVERHLEFLRSAPVPRFVKYLLLFVVSVSWKYIYYAPNTLSVMDEQLKNRLKREHIIYISFRNIFDFRIPHVRRLWSSCYIPYVLWHFALLPLLFLPLGSWAVWSVLITKLLAECITNIHAFIVIGPNHTGDDIPVLKHHYGSKEEFFVTQIRTSVNYRTGTEFLDHMQLWLNYQIEHHLFPYLPMLRYREAQPRVKELCAKYGVPYIQESIWKRLARMAAVSVGDRSAPRPQEPAALSII